MGRTDPFTKKFKTALRADPKRRARLDELLRQFVLTDFCKAVDPNGEHGFSKHGFIYQAEPSLRVHLPNNRSLGTPHMDSAHGHQPGELNSWMPLSRGVGGTNSLYCESVPGLGDLQPFAPAFGNFMRFYGNGLLHQTVANETDLTRVSIDIRIVPKNHFDNFWKKGFGTYKDDVAFKLGQYYRSTEESDDVVVS